ncbi:MAG: glycine--tRNA ligase subunit beta [Holosporales bacterium]|jgi:glycyl-tRNA synthetase beta chain|nr:glycine--tRNA ligase subunit beta [Holosporales bacterium]
MQQELLLEFFSEEIPARFQKKAVSDAKFVFEKILNDYGAEFSALESYISPRRITIRVLHLHPSTKDLCTKKRGPKISSSEDAINGFIKSNGKRKEDLFEENGYYYINTEVMGADIKEIMSDMIEDFIVNMPWPKSMRWYLEDQKTLSAFWVRPMRSILCVYNGRVIETHIKSLGITTCDYTFGHRFLSSGKIEISNFDDYHNKLEKSYVMLDFFKKREYIDQEITQKAASMGLCLTIDEDLLNEVAGLVEYPFIHIGTIDEKFMSLPSIVLSTSMKVHQKYFTLTYPNSVIAPFFGTVTNVPGTEIMHIGLDRVLRARLADAMFFYKEDTNVTLEAFAQRLSNVVFHEKLGLMSHKIDRMMSIAKTKEERRAVALCKADLLTQMVGEFPELQGIMGEIYAKGQDEELDVCMAIREHYKPLGAGGTLPGSKIGARVAFFDKLDTLVGFLGIGIYPTGSKDPFALRRAALCIIRLFCDFDEDILENEKLSWYIETLITSYSDQGIALEHDTLVEVETFITDRFKVYISGKLEVDHEIIKSVVSSFKSLDFDYKAAVLKAKRLLELTKLDEFQVVKEAYKRAAGVLGDLEFSTGSVRDLTFKDESMIALKDSVSDLEGNIFNFDLFTKAARSLLSACDNVLINTNDAEEKSKNLRLFGKFIGLIEKNIGIL